MGLLLSFPRSIPRRVSPSRPPTVGVSLSSWFPRPSGGRYSGRTSFSRIGWSARNLFQADTIT